MKESMKCERCLELLIEHAHGELDWVTRGAVSVHLGDCGDCATAYCRLEADIAGILDAHAQAPPAGVRERLRARVEQEFAPPWWRRALDTVTRPIPAYGALALSAVPFLIWLAAATSETKTDSEAAKAAASTPRVEAYDATRLPGIYRGVL